MSSSGDRGVYVVMSVMELTDVDQGSVGALACMACIRLAKSQSYKGTEGRLLFQ